MDQDIIRRRIEKAVREAFAEYQKAAQCPGILHYAGAKPWNDDRSELADLWWAVADTTSAGTALRLRHSMLRDDRLAEAVQLMGKPWLFLTYSFYKVLTLFVTGERRKESKRKSKLLKYLIRHGI
jgi:lipopolysaccharide biosynthesis glycosyltransferase